MRKDTFYVNEEVIKKGILDTKIITLQNFLGNKKIMYDILSNNPRSFDFLPLTASINVAHDPFREIIKNAMSSKIKTWILKPALGLQGDDIIISDNPKKMISFIENKSEYTDWVLSEYIDKPFLLKINGKSNSGAKFKDTIGRKTHIRIYVLITKINSETNIYLYKDNLIFCAAREYNPKNLKNKYSNLTNLHLGSLYYKKKLHLKPHLAYKDLSFPLKESMDEIFGPTFYDDVIFPQIENMLKVILESSEEYLQYSRKNKGCFHITAIDIMPDSEFKLHLLEINSSPGLNAPSYHWGTLDYFVNSLLHRTVDVISEKERFSHFKGFKKIK
jgi:hypothetical protein